MTDRELIELAAKAAGHKIAHWSHLKNAFWIDDADSWWNPLEYDADAFRLAVKLEITVSQWRGSVDAEFLRLVRPIQISIQVGVDRGYATRRAITMAAAEIAKECAE